MSLVSITRPGSMGIISVCCSDTPLDFNCKCSINFYKRKYMCRIFLKFNTQPILVITLFNSSSQTRNAPLKVLSLSGAFSMLYHPILFNFYKLRFVWCNCKITGIIFIKKYTARVPFHLDFFGFIAYIQV